MSLTGRGVPYVPLCILDGTMKKDEDKPPKQFLFRNILKSFETSRKLIFAGKWKKIYIYFWGRLTADREYIYIYISIYIYIYIYILFYHSSFFLIPPCCVPSLRARLWCNRERWKPAYPSTNTNKLSIFILITNQKQTSYFS